MNDSKSADDIFPQKRNLEKEIDTLKAKILQLEIKLEKWESFEKALKEQRDSMRQRYQKTANGEEIHPCS